MQNRYAGDIGDYLKLALLRAAAPGQKLGVAWWLFPDEDHNSDGRHVDYLRHPNRWRQIDPDLFEALCKMVGSGERSVAALEKMGVLPDTSYFRELCYFNGTPPERRTARVEWFARVTAWATDRSLVFVDPDNGIEPRSYSAGQRRAGKSISVSEIVHLATPGRALIVYHHQTRMPGGHQFEIGHWCQRLLAAGVQRVDAVRAAPYSARAFFIINAPDAMRNRIESAIDRWQSAKITWHIGG